MPTATWPGEDARRFGHEIGIVDRRRTEDDAGDALVEPRPDAAHVADAATELDRQVGRVEDRLDGAAVFGTPGEGAVQVDDVQPGEAGGGEAAGLRRRIAVEGGGARHVALLEAHALPVLQVDGREKDHRARASG